MASVRIATPRTARGDASTATVPIDTGKWTLPRTEPRAPRSNGLRHAFGRVRGRFLHERRGPLSFTLLALLVAIGVVLAVVAPGAARKVYALDDGGVWVTNGSQLLVGRLNYPSQVLDGGVRSTGSDLDVLQQGAQVVLVDRTRSTIAAVDTSAVTSSTSVSVPTDAVTMLGGAALGGEVAVFSPAAAHVWMAPLAALGQLHTTGSSAVPGVGHVLAAVVSASGALFTVDAGGRLLRTEPGTSPTLIGTLPGFRTTSKPSMTAVGDTPVVSDPATAALWIGTTRVGPTEKGVVLQAPSGAAPFVVYATAERLVEQPLTGGAAAGRDASSSPGIPATPVVVNGCAYGAWSGTARLVRWCNPGAPRATVLSRSIDGLTGALAFRVNRSRVVLNDPASGTMWLVDAGMQKVDDWASLKPLLSDTNSNTTKTERTVEQTAVTLPDRSGPNHPPQAQDDRFGVRAGTTAVLHVLDNDSDPDGDVLTATPDGDPSFGHVQAVDGGAALQVAVGADATGSTSFEYSVSDGRGGTAKARVELHVVPSGQDSPPVQLQVPTVSVESGATVTFSVLDGWRDPDGDPLQVTGVAASGSDSARSTPSGVITFAALGAGTGERDLRVVVSDGRLSTTGRVAVLVRPAGTASPVANNDRATASAGETITVAPLQNDVDPSTSPLRLVRTTANGAGVQVVPDYDRGTFSFAAQNPGSYYVQYVVAAGARSATGLVRVDVGPAKSSQHPVAMQDTAYLPSGGQVTVDPLANDIDPAGGVLVLESISVPSGVSTSVALVGHATVRLTDTGAAARPFEIGYVVANAAGTSQGVIRVVPTPAPAKALPPVAVADQAVVRAGDLVSVDVLANDVSPSGSRLYVVPTLVQQPPSSMGRAFVSGDRVRFLSNGRTGTVQLIYQVTDVDPTTGQSGVRAAGSVTIRVVGKAGADQPPRPQPLVGRVLQGQTVRIPVPLDGIDPDGDSVQLTGVGGATLGSAALVGDAVAYTALPGVSGTDSLTYTVQDRLGATATGTIRVGVAVPTTQNQPPQAVADTIRARPGREVAVDVLANDLDPDGDAITLVGATGRADRATVSGGRVVVTVPEAKGTTAVSYEIRDARGATATGSLAVVSDPAAPLLPPIARDDEVTPQQVAGRTTVLVPVLANDDDPDGVAAQLVPSVVSGAATVRGKQLAVAVEASPQIVVYSVRDIDGLTATAIVRVPGSSRMAPVLRAGVSPVRVDAGKSVSIDLRNYIAVRPGHSVRVTQTDRVRAPGAQSVSVTGATSVVYTAATTEVGMHTMSVEVTDGRGPDDPTGLKATVTIPVQVMPTGDLPPTFAGGSISVAKGEPAAVFDLRAASADPNPGDLGRLTYRATSPSGFTTSVQGGELRVATSAAVGTVGTLAVTVSDGHLTGKGTVTVTVIASTRPLAVAVTDVVPDARAGQTVAVPVLANDSNPFPGTPLRVLDASVVTPNAGSAVVQKDRVAVTPRAGFSGTLTARYRIADATGAADRVVQGTILVTVRAAPDAPGVPGVVSSQSRQVTLTWLAGADNGSPITHYLVTSNRGTSTSCPATTCTIGGLDNGTQYAFTVEAVNAVGTSAPSGASVPVTPDARPDAPVLNTIDYGDGTLTVTWQNGQNLGSALTSSVVTVSPGQTYDAGAGSTSYTVTGLTNGAQYAVSVQSVNKAGASDPSNVLSDSPAGAPGTVGTPTVSSANAVGSQSQVQVGWNAAAPNAESLTGYRVKVTSGGALITQTDVGLDQRSLNVTLNNADSDYAIAVAARNKATDAGKSPVTFGPSAAYHAEGNPGAPSTPTATAGDGSIGLSWSAGDRNGVAASAIGYEYDLNGDGNWRSVPSPSGGPTSFTATVSAGITNGTAYSVRVRAVGDGRTGSPSGSSAAVTPYGKPNPPSVTATGNDTSVTLSWAPGATNGRPISQIMVSINGGAFTAQGPGAGSTVQGNQHSQTETISAYEVDSAGQQSATVTAQATSAPAPQPSATVSRGPTAPPSSGCTSNNCPYLVLNYANFPAGSYQYDCLESGVPFYSSSTHNRPISVSGTGSIQLPCFDGYSNPVSLHVYGGSVNLTTPSW